MMNEEEKGNLKKNKEIVDNKARVIQEDNKGDNKGDDKSQNAEKF